MSKLSNDINAAAPQNPSCRCNKIFTLHVRGQIVAWQILGAIDVVQTDPFAVDWNQTAANWLSADNKHLHSYSYQHTHLLKLNLPDHIDCTCRCKSHIEHLHGSSSLRSSGNGRANSIKTWSTPATLVIVVSPVGCYGLWLCEKLNACLAIHVQIPKKGSSPACERKEGQRYRDWHIDAHHAHLQTPVTHMSLHQQYTVTVVHDVSVYRNGWWQPAHIIHAARDNHLEL